jgi:hypothetical protein
MESLETVYFKSDPTDKEAEELARRDEISAILRRWPQRPVYMITGLKIAKRLRFSQATNTEGSRQLTNQLDESADRNISDSFRLRNDVILAYQMHIIEKKGLRGRKIKAGVYNPAGGFLGMEESQNDHVKEEPVTTRPACGDDLSDSAGLFEVDCGEPEEAQFGGQRFVLISFEEP